MRTQLSELPSLPNIEFETQIQKNIVLLSDYSSKGLDRDLLLYRLCEITTNRGFTPEQTSRFYKESITIWNLSLNDRPAAIAKIQQNQKKLIQQNELLSVDFRQLKEMFDNKYRSEGLEISKSLSEKYDAGHIIFGILDSEFYYPPVNSAGEYSFVVDYSNIIIDQNPFDSLKYRISSMKVHIKSESQNVDLMINLNFDVPKSPSSYTHRIMGIAPDLPVAYFEMIDGKSNIPIYAIG